jgi:hypothetical protein
MEADVVNLGKEIDRLERQATLDAELNKPTADPLTNKPAANGMDTKSGRASDEYKKAFWNVMRAKNPRYDVVNALQIGTDSEADISSRTNSNARWLPRSRKRTSSVPLPGSSRLRAAIARFPL